MTALCELNMRKKDKLKANLNNLKKVKVNKEKTK